MNSIATNYGHIKLSLILVRVSQVNPGGRTFEGGRRGLNDEGEGLVHMGRTVNRVTDAITGTAVRKGRSDVRE